MKKNIMVKRIIAVIAVAAVLATGVGGYFYFMNWHNKQMADMKKKCDAAVKAAQEEDERRQEVETSLNELAKNNKDLEKRIEIIINNRDAWEKKSKKLEEKIEDYKKKYTRK